MTQISFCFENPDEWISVVKAEFDAENDIKYVTDKDDLAQDMIENPAMSDEPLVASALPSQNVGWCVEESYGSSEDSSCEGCQIRGSHKMVRWKEVQLKPIQWLRHDQSFRGTAGLQLHNSIPKMAQQL